MLDGGVVGEVPIRGTLAEVPRRWGRRCTFDFPHESSTTECNIVVHGLLRVADVGGDGKKVWDAIAIGFDQAGALVAEEAVIKWSEDVVSSGVVACLGDGGFVACEAIDGGEVVVALVDGVEWDIGDGTDQIGGWVEGADMVGVVGLSTRGWEGKTGGVEEDEE